MTITYRAIIKTGNYATRQMVQLGFVQEEKRDSKKLRAAIVQASGRPK